MAWTVLGPSCGAGSRAEIHFLSLSNLEVFHLPDLGCLLGHPCHSFKCRTSKEPFSAQDQRKLYKLSNFIICTHQSRHRVKKTAQEPWPPNSSFVKTPLSQPWKFFFLAPFYKTFSISRPSINSETSQQQGNYGFWLLLLPLRKVSATRKDLARQVNPPFPDCWEEQQIHYLL